MSTTWILIANSSQANLYKTHKAKLFQANGHDEENISLIKSFSHESSRKKTLDLISDKSGNYHYGTSGHGSFIEPTDPKIAEEDRFARQLALALENGRLEGAYDDIVLVAAPHFQGLLHKHLNHELARLISARIDKDYTHIKGRELAEQLRDHL